MKTMMKHNQTLVMSALLAAVLVGCGGGGGGDNGGSNAGNAGNGGGTNAGQTQPPSNTSGPDLQNVVPAPTYAAGSQEQAAWEVLNQARQACGFGMLAQDARLDAAAKAHAKYLDLNPALGLAAHEENTGASGFTGKTSTDRARAQGYPYNAGESLAVPTKYMTNLLATVYHGKHVLEPAQHVGLGFTSGEWLAVETGNRLYQKLGKGVVANYPCEGAKNVDATWGGEVPEPFADLAGAYKGTTIHLRSDVGSVLSITNLSIVRESSGQLASYRPPESVI